jgi:hypothetical protein
MSETRLIRYNPMNHAGRAGMHHTQVEQENNALLLIYHKCKCFQNNTVKSLLSNHVKDLVNNDVECMHASI